MGFTQNQGWVSGKTMTPEADTFASRQFPEHNTVTWKTMSIKRYTHTIRCSCNSLVFLPFSKVVVIWCVASPWGETVLFKVQRCSGKRNDISGLGSVYQHSVGEKKHMYIALGSISSDEIHPPFKLTHIQLSPILNTPFKSSDKVC